MKLLFRKTILIALVAALGMASLPLVSVAAQGEGPGKDPNAKLERVWARQQRVHTRLGKRFEHGDEFIAKAQKLIDHAQAEGKDVAALQAALDAFQAAVQKAHPIYESTQGIVSSHQGFDANGKVTDATKAQATIDAMREKFTEIRAAMNGTGKALREAIRAFREANPRPKPTPTTK